MKNENRNMAVFATIATIIALLAIAWLVIMVVEKNDLKNIISDLDSLYNQLTSKYDALEKAFGSVSEGLNDCMNETAELQNNITSLQSNITDLINKSQTPLLSLHFEGWWDNVYGGKIFGFWVFNYGATEAKNILTECYVDNAYGIKTTIASRNIGNMASHTTEYYEILMNHITQTGDKGYCRILSCDNCEILEKRIPALN